MYEIYIVDEIDDDSPARLRKQLEKIPSDAPIDVHINSTGGSVPSGCTMANMIAMHKGLTRGFIDGVCCSIATQIFFACRRRFMPLNAFLMIHSPSLGTSGNARELRKSAADLDVIQRGLEAAYLKAARKGVTEEQIHALVENETWLTATDAAKLFDITVVEPSKAINAATQIAKMFERKDIRMKRSDELKLEIADKQMQLESYKNSSDTKNFYKVTGEIQALMNECQLALEKEQNRLCNFLQSAVPIDATHHADNQTLRNRAFNKMLFSKVKGEPPRLTEAEKSAYFNVDASGSPSQVEGVPERGGYIVGIEQMNRLQEFRAAYTALKPYTTVITAGSNHGRWPTLPDQAIEFEPLVEMGEISESEIHFGELEYTISDFGLIIPASNQILQDADVDLISIIGKTLAKAAIRTENKQILSKISPLFNDPQSVVETITDHKSLNTALYQKLDAVYEPAAKIFVNQDSFVWLSNLDDGQGRPLLVPDVTAPNKYFYRGKEIVLLPNATFPSWNSGAFTYAPILCGDMSSFLFFFERKGLELTTSDSYLWRRNAFAVRAIERFDVVVADPNAIVALQIKL